MRAATWVLALVLALLDIVWLAFTLRLWMLRHKWEIKQRSVVAHAFTVSIMPILANAAENTPNQDGECTRS